MERNDADAALLLETIQAFWWHVENDLEPGDPLPVEAPDIEDMSVLDMSMHNRFVAVVGVLSDNHDRVQAYRAAEAELKAMMPPRGQGRLRAAVRSVRARHRPQPVPRRQAVAPDR